MRPVNISAHVMAPNHFKVLLENERVRVLDFHAKHLETNSLLPRN